MSMFRFNIGSEGIRNGVVANAINTVLRNVLGVDNGDVALKSPGTGKR